jgi:hypothetical protein
MVRLRSRFGRGKVALRHWLLFLGLLVGGAVGLRAAEGVAGSEPITFFEWPAPDGSQRVGDRPALAAAKVNPSAAVAVFRALPAEEWPQGCTPIFVVEREGRFELRRLPPRGEENFVEPLFAALPPENDGNAARLTGAWQCSATRPGGSDAWFIWHLAVDGEMVRGRFDPATEFRVAGLAGGTLRTNRLELTVEYSNDAYLLTGEWHDGKLRGRWVKHDSEEGGQWEAARATSAPERLSARLPADEPVPLYEWRREREGARHYSIGTNSPGPAWTHPPRVLCRVWKSSAPSPKPSTAPPIGR